MAKLKKSGCSPVLAFAVILIALGLFSAIGGLPRLGEKYAVYWLKSDVKKWARELEASDDAIVLTILALGDRAKEAGRKGDTLDGEVIRKELERQMAEEKKAEKKR